MFLRDGLLLRLLHTGNKNDRYIATMMLIFQQ